MGNCCEQSHFSRDNSNEKDEETVDAGNEKEIHDELKEIKQTGQEVAAGTSSPERVEADEDIHVHADSDITVEHLFPKLGIRLSYVLNQFVEECGGRNALAGWTTTEVCNMFIKPVTITSKVSYCEMLMIQQQRYGDDSKDIVIVDHASVFISHVWKYEFLHVLDALRDHFEQEPHKIIWFDLFSDNQHQTSELRPTSFKSGIRDFGHTVLVMSPWNCPIPYTRAWCILEAHLTAVTGSRFEIAMSAIEFEDFLKTCTINPDGAMRAMIGNVNARKSTSLLPGDREQIFEVLEEFGFAAINALLFDQLRKWIIAVAKKELDANENSQRRPYLLRMLGILYRGQGRHDTSQAFLEEALEITRCTLGNGHNLTLVCKSEVADLYTKQGNYDAALPLTLECLDNGNFTVKQNHYNNLNALSKLSLLYRKMHRFEDAVTASVECLERSKDVLGPDHPSTLITMNNTALLFSHQKKYTVAKQMFLECLERRKTRFGTNDTNTIHCMNGLAECYYIQGNYVDALPLIAECAEKYEAILGADHWHTLNALQGLSNVREKLKGDSTVLADNFL